MVFEKLPQFPHRSGAHNHHPLPGTNLRSGEVRAASNGHDTRSHSLREQSDRYYRIMETLTEGIWEIDAEHRTTFANGRMATMLGYTLEEMLGRSLFEFMDDEGRAIATVNLERRRQGISEQHDFKFRHKDGSDVWAIASSIPFVDSDGQYAGTLATLTDISDRVRRDAEHKQTEAALQESQTRFRNAFESAGIGMAIVGLEGRWLKVNHALCEMTGYTEAELLALTVQAITHPDDQAKTTPFSDQLTTGKQCPDQLEKRYLHKQGQVIWVLLSRSLIRSVAGKPLYFITQIQDITAQKQAESLLRSQVQREQALSRLIQSIHKSLDLSDIFSTTAYETGALFGTAWAEIVRYCPSQNCWRNVAEYRRSPELPSLLGREAGDDQNTIAERLKRLEIVCIEDPTQAQDLVNSPIFQELPGRWLFVPIQIEAKVWGALLLIRDPSQQPWQAAEVELLQTIANQLAIAIQQSELYQQVQQLNSALELQVEARTAELQQALHYETTLKHITDAVRDSLDETHILHTVVRELGQVLQVVCCDAALYNAERTVSTIAYDYVVGIPSAQGKTNSLSSSPVHQQLLRGQSSQFCFLPAVANSSRPDSHQLAILCCPILDNQDCLGDLWLFKLHHETFSELEERLVKQVANQCAIALRQSRLHQAVQAQVQELERLNAVKDDFVSTVSHELRAPMANIRMATQMMELGLSSLATPEPRLNRYLTILREECQRETNLINDLLDLARLERGTAALNLTEINLQDWLPHVLAPFQDRANHYRQKLLIQLAPALPQLTTDVAYLERILVELLNNACKYTPPEEKIILAVAIAATELRISITNTGIEIPLTERDRIFEKFYRIPNNDPWKCGGTGLGLALVKKMAERLGAAIQLESHTHQTTFTLIYPTG